MKRSEDTQLQLECGGRTRKSSMCGSMLAFAILGATLFALLESSLAKDDETVDPMRLPMGISDSGDASPVLLEPMLPQSTAPSSPSPVEPAPLPPPAMTDRKKPAIVDKSARTDRSAMGPSTAATITTNVPLDLLRSPIQKSGELPNYQPIARAAQNMALTPAESMVDGLGGMPSTITARQQESLLNASRTPFFIGPVQLVCPSFFEGISEGKFVDRAPHSSVNNATPNGVNAGAIDGFHSTTGLSLGLTLGRLAIGRYLTLEYSALYRYPGDRTTPANQSTNGSRSSDSRAFDQQLSLAGEWDEGKCHLGLGISFASLSGTSRDIGGNANTDSLNVSLTSSYAWTPKTSLDCDLNVSLSQVSGGSNSVELRNTMFVRHQVSPKSHIGAGLVVGVEDQGGSGTNSPSALGADQLRQSFEQALVEIGWVPSPKVTLSGNLGAEYRQAGHYTAINPTFALNAAWTPRLGTTFTLSASEITQSSASMVNQNFTSTSFYMNFSQRLGKAANLCLGIGYEHAPYQTVAQSSSLSGSHLGASEQRVDNLYTAQAALHFQFHRGWSASLSYTFTENRSTSDGFRSSLGQFSLGYTF